MAPAASWRLTGLALAVAVGCGHPHVAVPALAAASVRPSQIEPWMGTPHPILVQAASYRHRWLVACQARRDTDGDSHIRVMVGRHGETYGDETQPFLMRGAGPGEPIDLYLGASASKRHLAFVQHGRLIVLDAVTGQRRDLTALGADSADDGNASLAHPGVAFVGSHHVAFIKRGSERQKVHLLDLSDGAARVAFESTALLWRVEFDAEHDSLGIWEIPADTDGDGHLQSPRIPTTRAARGCRGTSGSYSVYGIRGDRPERRTVPLALGQKDSEPRERLEVERGCLPNGSSALVSSSDGGVLVNALGPGRLSDADFGPVRWRKAAEAPYGVDCTRQDDLPACPATLSDQQPGTFCAVSIEGAYGANMWGRPPAWVWMGDREHVDVRWKGRTFAGGVDGPVYVHGTGRGDVWVLEGRDPTLLRWDGVRWGLERGPLFKGVTKVFAVSPRAAWAYGKEGRVLRWAGVGWERVSLPTLANVVGFWASGAGNAWATDAAGMTHRFDGRQWSALTHMRHGAVVRLHRADGELFGITSEGELARLDGRDWHLVTRLVLRERRYFERLLALNGPGPDDLWVGTSNGRLHHWDGHAVRTYDGLTGASFEDIVSVGPDDVWINASGTLARFRRPLPETQPISGALRAKHQTG